jgi:dihydropteroate synthase
MSRYQLDWNGYRLNLGLKTAIMGILNVTPDSFSDGGRFYSRDAAVAQGMALAEAGADIIDIGGESTRPYAAEITADEEMTRVIPVIESLTKQIDRPISIDTTKAAVAEAAVAAGASIINDISALRMDPAIAGVAARLGVPVILMHMQGEPRTMQIDPRYDDVVAEVKRFLAQAIEQAVAAGIARERIIVDPGIGFGKTATHNLLLLHHLNALDELGAPILVGPSRKAFIRRLLGQEAGGELPADHAEVEIGTQAAVAAAILNGAHIVRVHHVSGTRATVKIADAIRNAKV